MTADTRFDRDLTAVLEDLYLGPSPDYRVEALATATHRRQRPSWTFPGRWLPMTDAVSTAPIVAPVRWRTIGGALLIIALLIAALAVFAGSQRTRPAPPFGVAANGPIAYARKGDLFTLDPATGVSRPLVTSGATEIEPMFSPDGTRLAFRRKAGTLDAPTEDVIVANPDGSNPMVITPSPIPKGPFGMAWSPDSRSILLNAWAVDDTQSYDLTHPVPGEVRLYDATRAAPPRVLARGADFSSSPFRPANGESILLSRPAGDSGAREWYLVNLATGSETRLVVASDPSFARWSPDGSKVVYVDGNGTVADTHLLYVVNADGTGQRRVTTEPATIAEFDPIWSPDGTRIAFSRAEWVDRDWAIRQSGIASVATGTTAPVGPLARNVRAANPSLDDAQAGKEESFNLDWSPDGRFLLGSGLDAAGHIVLIDATSGEYRVLDVVATAANDRPASIGQTWQRLAP